MTHRSAVVLILLSALGFGSMALFAKIAYASGVSPAMLLALRFALAAAMLAPLVWLRGLRLPRGRALLGFGLMGAIYTVQSQSYFTALLHASSGLVGLLLYVYPVLVTLLSIALGWEKPDRRMFALLGLAIAGMIVMLGGDLQGEPLGIALGLLGAALYAVYIVIGGRMMDDTDPMAATLVIMSVAAVGNLLSALAGDASLPAGAAGWSATFAIALFSTVIAIACFLVGIKHVGPAQASILSTLEPAITICLGVALLGETVGVGQLLGGAMVLAAVIMLALRPRTAAADAAEAAAG